MKSKYTLIYGVVLIICGIINWNNPPLPTEYLIVIGILIAVYDNRHKSD